MQYVFPEFGNSAVAPYSEGLEETPFEPLTWKRRAKAGASPGTPVFEDSDWQPLYHATRAVPVARPQNRDPGTPLILETTAPLVAPPPPSFSPALDIVANADSLAHVQESARVKGFEEGRVWERAEIRSAFDLRLNQLEVLLESLTEARAAIFERTRSDLVAILSLVPRKILRQSLKIDPQAIVAMVGSILEELPHQERVVVTVSNDDLSLLQQALTQLQRRLGGYTRIDLEASPALSRGDSVINLEGGRIEATIERQLEIFEQRAHEWIMGMAEPAVPSTTVPLAYSSYSRVVES